MPVRFIVTVDETLRLISVRFPWVLFILCGIKPIECRDRKCNLQAPLKLLLQASTHVGKEEKKILKDYGLWDAYEKTIQHLKGKIVALITVNSWNGSEKLAKEIAPYHSFPDCKYYVISDVRPLVKPIPCAGHTTVRKLGRSSDKAVLDQLKDAHCLPNTIPQEIVVRMRHNPLPHTHPRCTLCHTKNHTEHNNE